MTDQLVLTVGNGMMGDDGAGVLLAQMMRQSPVSGWQVLNGGSAPENILHQVRDLAPERILVIDSADMDLPPGEIRCIQDELLADPFLITTHTLPLTFLLESLREFVPKVELVGIQPDVIAFGFPMSPVVIQAVEQVYSALRNGQAEWPAHTSSNNVL